jgi:DNA relaxase NicK
MRFDWYQASIPGAEPEVVMNALSAADRFGDWEQMRPLKNYDSAAAFVVGNETRFKINFGGQNSEHGPNVIGSGSSAQHLADVIRERFPLHRVSRLDSCEDYHHPDAYDYLRRAALKIAKEQRVQCREIVKPLPESDDGRTLYLGSQTSAVSMRIYEKGKQLGVSGEWVRAEIQVRPQKELKTIVSMLDSTEVWGLSKWSQAMAVQLGKKGVQRVDAQVYEQSDHDRAYRFMLKQYRRVLEQMLATHGSPEAVGAQIFYDLAHPDDVPPKASLRPFKEV